MGSAYVEIDHRECTIEIQGDRSPGPDWVLLRSKTRLRPRAHMRGALVSQIRGFLEQRDEYATFRNLEDELQWLAEHWDGVVQGTFINSPGLQEWMLKVSRRMFKPPRR